MFLSNNAGRSGINAHVETCQITLGTYAHMRGSVAISESTDFSRLVFVSCVVLKRPNELLGNRSRPWFEAQNFAELSKLLTSTTVGSFSGKIGNLPLHTLSIRRIE